jgi:hypothetical protein
MTTLNGRTVIVANVTANTYTMVDPVTGARISILQLIQHILLAEQPREFTPLLLRILQQICQLLSILSLPT